MENKENGIKDLIDEMRNDLYLSIYSDIINKFTVIFEKILLTPISPVIIDSDMHLKIWTDRVNVCINLLREKAKEYKNGN